MDLEHLPAEIIYNILLRIDLEKALSLCGQNKAINEICNSDYYWIKRLEQDYGQDIDPNLSPKNNYLLAYFQRNFLGRSLDLITDDEDLSGLYAPVLGVKVKYPLNLYLMDGEYWIYPDIIISNGDISDYFDDDDASLIGFDRSGHVDLSEPVDNVYRVVSDLRKDGYVSIYGPIPISLVKPLLEIGVFNLIDFTPESELDRYPDEFMDEYYE